MARRASQPQGHGERLAVAEERLDAMDDKMADVLGKLDALLRLGAERASAIEGVKLSVDRLRLDHAAMRKDTAFIRQGMVFTRIMRRLVLWGAPFVAAAIWIAERSDLIAKLFRRS
ncbi:hypothetical protein [Bosea sp. (in: a-proteobacteria)]|uniref:hypothetical protein n=1 Tax=Bosea sp. (in: a-proteobacteria) TaxID=1871050 RepID=UPI002603231F|nr:hypothetical protein [Bosea sp. (in: a-proteobacteria)]MCO5092008.1 hypothetical protein [Bosea sp. (in: a-proteobacteria)]